MKRRFGRGEAPGGVGGIVVESLVIAVVGAVLGAIVWNIVSPDVMAEATDNGLRLSTGEARREFGIEVAFAGVTAGVGLLAGAVLMLRHRAEPVASQVAAVGSGVLGALAVWQLGHRFVGPGDLAAWSGEAEPGTLVEVSLDVASYAVFVIWPIAALIGGAVIIAILDRPVREDS